MDDGSTREDARALNSPRSINKGARHVIRRMFGLGMDAPTTDQRGMTRSPPGRALLERLSSFGGVMSAT